MSILSTPLMDPIPPHDAAAVLRYWKQPVSDDYPPLTDYQEQLLKTIALANAEHRARLQKAYPAYVLAFEIVEQVPDGLHYLSTLMQGGIPSAAYPKGFRCTSRNNVARVGCELVDKHPGAHRYNNRAAGTSHLWSNPATPAVVISISTTRLELDAMADHNHQYGITDDAWCELCNRTVLGNPAHHRKLHDLSNQAGQTA